MRGFGSDYSSSIWPTTIAQKAKPKMRGSGWLMAKLNVVPLTKLVRARENHCFSLRLRPFSALMDLSAGSGRGHGITAWGGKAQ